MQRVLLALVALFALLLAAAQWIFYPLLLVWALSDFYPALYLNLSTTGFEGRTESLRDLALLALLIAGWVLVPPSREADRRLRRLARTLLVDSDSL